MWTNICVSVTAKPSALTNCTLRTATNHSSDALEVECRAGYDGGLPQRFILEAYESHTTNLRLNLTSSNTDYPLFKLELSDLLPVSNDIHASSPPTLHIVVYAQNAKGRSELTVLEDIALNDAEKRTGTHSVIDYKMKDQIRIKSSVTVKLYWS